MSSIIPIVKPKIFLPIWIYKYLALTPFIGFFGIDHWALDSKFTGIAKLFVNMLTFGSWYAYDIVQAWNGIRADKKTIQAEGLDIPFFEGYNIGKGKFDAEPLSNMSNNSQMWLLILSIGLFAFVYYIITFFLTSTSGFLISSIATISFYGILALSAYTIYFFFMSRVRSSLFSPPKTRSEAKQSLYRTSGVVNPLTAPRSTSRVASALSGTAPGLQLPRMGGGGGALGGFDGVSDLVETLKSMEPIPFNYDHLHFISLLLIIPFSGFVAYGLTKNKVKIEKDELS